MYDAFATIDGGGPGRGAGDDKRITLDEFVRGYREVSQQGLVGLAGIRSKEHAKEVFSKIDDNGGGVVLLDEWCFYLKGAESSAGTEVGKLLQMDEAGGVGKQAKLSGPAGVNPKDKKALSQAAREKARLAVAARLAPKAAPVADSTQADEAPKENAGSVDVAALLASFGPPNAFGLTVGKSATKEFRDFAACFEPLCAESPEGERLREEGFKAADPNGNGLCSLAELETFVMKQLVGKYPKTGKGKELKEPGRDLFDAFRPSYVRAFSDAKDYKADTGKVIEGTKRATDDDFVSKEEFRLFCCYLIVYRCDCTIAVMLWLKLSIVVVD